MPLRHLAGNRRCRREGRYSVHEQAHYRPTIFLRRIELSGPGLGERQGLVTAPREGAGKRISGSLQST